MHKNVYLFFVVFLLGFSFFLRIHNLSTTPPILSENELRTGLATINNSIITPYIAPLAVVVSKPFIQLLGLSPFSVRLPSVFFATVSILLFFLLVHKLFPSAALLSLLFFVISSYAIQLSRIDTGLQLGLCFFLLGVYALIYFSKHPRLFFVATAFFALSVYSHFAFFVPSLVVLVIALYLLEKRLKQRVVKLRSLFHHL